MSELLSRLGEIIQDIIRALGYPGVAFLTFAENVFPPIPSELVLPFAGFLAGRGDPNFQFFGAWLASLIGSVLGAVVLYYIGMFAGDSILRRILRRYGKLLTVSERDYDRALAYFEKYGSLVVFFGRLIPIIRSIISIPAGMNHMPMVRFLILTTIGAGIWNALLIGAGIALGANWEQVLEFMDTYQNVTIVVLGLVIVLVVAWFVWSRVRNRNRADDPNLVDRANP